MDNIEVGPKSGETADQFKARIKETERELKRESIAASKPVSEPPAQVNATVPESKSPTPEVPKGITTGNKDVDEWLGKKGFKNTEDMATSLRELERELHKRASEAKPPQAPPAAIPPPVTPGFMPGYMPQQAPPMYAYPPVAQYPPYQQPAPIDEEKLAASYGLAVEDFKKVAAIANDLAESKVEQRLKTALAPVVNRLQTVDREVSRNSEVVGLMSDPTFKNPQVQYEMHRILEEDPTIFVKQPQPYQFAYNTALMRIAKEQLGGSQSKAPVSQPVPVPSGRPPQTAGSNGGGGGAPEGILPDQVTPEIFAKMTHADKRAHLMAIGALGQ